MDLSGASEDPQNISDIHNIQDLYLNSKKEEGDQKETAPLMILDEHYDPKKTLAPSKIHKTYFKAIRKAMVRRRSKVFEDPSEFADQVKEIKENVRTLNEMRIADLKIIEKTPMEKLKSYKDKLPLLRLRKRIMKVWRVISLICLKIISHPLFDLFILTVVLINSLLLAMDNPTDDVPAISTGVDNLLLGIYTAEAVLKIAGMGFLFNTSSYLRDPWNIMDFVIVVTAYIPIIFVSGGVNLQAFRALRVLRPLRTISNIKALKVIVLTLLAAIGPLLETIFILFFMIMIFAIAGLQLFQGLLKKRCIALPTGIAAVSETDGDDAINNEVFCTLDSDCTDYDGVLHICAKMIANPNWNITNFDNLPASILMVFQSITKEGWSSIMAMLEKTFSFAPLVVIYFIVLLIICSFFLLSLTLAVIKAEFTSKSMEEDGKKKKIKGAESYQARLNEKLESYKGQVLKLMRKRQNEEITYNRYEFRKENLVAFDAKANAQAKARSRRSIVGLNERKRRLTQMIDKIVLKGTARRSIGYLSGLFRRLTSADSAAKVSPLTPGNLLDDNKNLINQTDNSSHHKVLDSHRKLMQKEDPSSPGKDDTAQETYGGEVTVGLPTTVHDQNHPKVASLDAIGSIPEANEQSEQSIKTPSEVSFGNGSQTPRVSIRNKWRGSTDTQTPIRPVMTEKVQIKPAPDSGVAIINIAGIRNTLNPEEHRELAKSSDRVVSPVPSSKDISFSEERGQPSSIQKMKNPKKKKTGISANLMRQMNQIIMAGSKKKSQPHIHGHSHNHVHGKETHEALPSIFELEQPSEDFERFAGSMMIHSDLLDDSDFFDDEQRYQLLKKKRKSRTLTKTRQLTALPGTVKLSSKTQLKELPETTGILPNAKFVQPGEKEEKKIVIDIRKFKAVPAFDHQYEADSLDDVLPLKKEREEQKLEEDEQNSIRAKRMKLHYRITKHDDLRAESRYNKKYNGPTSSTTLVVQANETTVKIRKKKLAQKQAEEGDINGTLYGNNSSSALASMGRSSSKNFSSKKTMRTGGANRMRFVHHGHDDDYLSSEKMKDFFEVLKRINKPFDNEEKEKEEEALVKASNGKDLTSTKIYRDIRKRDLASDVVGFNNWSGDNILSSTKVDFATEKAKKALNNQDYDIWRPGYWGVLHAMRRQIKFFVESDIFNNFILISVVLNTVVLATQGLVSGDRATNITNNANLAFTIIFTIEMGLKLIALGIVGYARDKINLFDCAIVALSLIDMTSLTGSGQNQAVSAFKAIRLLRTFRVLRVTKLLRSLSYVKVIIGVVMRSMHKFIFIFVLLLLFIYIYALLGMQIYGGNLDLDDNVGQGGIRQNFDSFINAFMAVFQIMTQENWNDLLYLTLRAPGVSNAFSLLYLLSWLSIGNYIFLNLFLAILLDEFTGEEVEEELEEMEEENEEDDAHSTGVRSTSTGKLMTTGGGKTSSFKNSSKGSLQGRSQGSIGEQFSTSKGSEEDKRSSASHKHGHQKKRVLCRKSLYIFTQDNFLRKFCLNVIYHPKFESVILFMIIVSSIKLALDTYITTSQVTLTDISNTFDQCLNIFFAIEMGFKVISLGFLFDDGSYLRDSWNVLDFIIVITSIIDMASESVNLPFIKILRLLRTLRPLRFVSHNPSMKLIVTALLESVKAIFNVVVVILLVWLMFCILAINIVGDKLGYCDGLPDDEYYYGINETMCAQEGYTWKNQVVNFDNVVSGMLSLFVMSTLENWPGIMYTFVDANDATIGPTKNKNELFGYIYMIVFVFVGSFFLINLFIGVIFLEYTQASKRENKMQKFLTPEQQNWVIMQRLVVSAKGDDSNVEPEKKWMKPYFRLINHFYFEMFITIVILINIIMMAINYDGSSSGFDNVLKYSNWAFSVLFAIELVLKHLGLGFRRFWRSDWNKFDAFVVFASVLDIVMDFAQQSFMKYIKVAPQIARVFRVMRVTRLFKLIKSLEGLQKMINTLIFSLPSLLNVGALLFLVYYIYAILATFLFGTIESGDVVNGTFNFKNAANSFVTLFLCSTGENWYMYMFDTISPAECTAGTQSCGTPAAYPFWISFTVICQYIFLNLFILVILQQFEEYHLNPDNPVNKFRETLEDVFKPHWEKYALKYGGLHMHESQLLDFFTTLSAPLGFKDSGYSKKYIAKEIMKMTISSDQHGMVFYNEILHVTFKNGFQRDPVTDFTQYQYLLKEETKTRAKLEKIKLRMIPVRTEHRLTIKEVVAKHDKSVANPILRMLFVGMTIKSWMRYASVVGEKMKAAKQNNMEYIPSDSDEDDYITASSSSSEEEEEEVYSEEEVEEDNGRIYEENEENEDDRGSFSPNANGASRDQDLSRRSGGVNQSHAASTGRKVQEKIFKFDSDDEKEMLYGDDDKGDVKIEGLVSNSKKDVNDEEKNKALLNNSLNIYRNKSSEDPARKSSFNQGPRIFMQTVEGEIKDITPRATPIGSKSNIEPSFDLGAKKKGQ